MRQSLMILVLVAAGLGLSHMAYGESAVVNAAPLPIAGGKTLNASYDPATGKVFIHIPSPGGWGIVTVLRSGGDGPAGSLDVTSSDSDGFPNDADWTFVDTYLLAWIST